MAQPENMNIYYTHECIYVSKPWSDVGLTANLNEAKWK